MGKKKTPGDFLSFILFGSVNQLCCFVSTLFQFINERLDMLNTGQGFSDIFEVEATMQGDKLNAQSRYKDWLSSMKVSILKTFLVFKILLLKFGHSVTAVASH